MKEKNITLEAKLESHTLEIEDLKEEISKLKEELKKKDGIIESLQTQIKDLKEKEKAKCNQDKLYISQAAFQFEQAICTYVLRDVFEKDQHATIKSLLKYLHGRSKLPVSDPEGELLLAAKKKWDEVCGELNLPTINEEIGNFTDWGLDESATPDIMRAVYCLKESRIPIAHPESISLKVAGEKLQSPAVKNSLPEWQLPLIESFIAAVQRSIERSGSKIYSKHFELDCV